MTVQFLSLEENLAPACDTTNKHPSQIVGRIFERDSTGSIAVEEGGANFALFTQTTASFAELTKLLLHVYTQSHNKSFKTLTNWSGK